MNILEWGLLMITLFFFVLPAIAISLSPAYDENEPPPPR